MTLSQERSVEGPSPRRSYWWIQAFDVAITVAAFALAFSLRIEFAFSDAHWLALLVGIPIVAAVALAAYHMVGLFRGTWSQTAEADLIVVVKGTSLVSVILIAGMVFTNTLEQIPRSVPLIHWFITVVALYGSRMLWAKRQSREEAVHRSVAILVGCNPSALRFLTSIQALASRRIKIFGLLDETSVKDRVGRTIRGTPVIGRIENAAECLAQLSVHGVFPDRFVVMQSFSRTAPDQFAKIKALSEKANMTLDVIDDTLWHDDSQKSQAEADLPANAKPLLSVRRYMRWRRPIEWLVAMCLVTVLSPLFVLLAVVCAIDVGRPVFFWQMRPGRYLKPIKLIKFRTMRNGLDAEGKPLSDEQRTSMLGWLIRRSKLDELPQLLSILKGDMSFIGPRPLLPRDQPEEAQLRAIVRPGVTGWAQVNGGHPLKNEEKLALDIWYIKNASLWLDLKVIWLTAKTVIFGERVNRDAIDRALRTREMLRPAARQFQVVVGNETLDGGADAAGGKPGERSWWSRPVSSLDRAS